MKASGIITYEQSSQLVHSISSTDFSSSSFSELKSLILESTVRHDSLKTRTLLLSRQCLDDVRKQLEEQKIPIVDSPNEGEALCAYLTSTGRAYASATEDMDCCVFGDGPVIRYLARSVTSFHQSQSLSLALSTGELGLTREQYVDLMILCGSDFSSTLKRVGDKTALKLIKKHGSIEKILALGNYEPNEGFDYVGARRVFLEGTKQMEEFVSMEELDEAIRVYRSEND
ncbi:PIN domain-like protein [Obelidium mucronatum]|nr:PIN domain-like protein [Obelidium mucronatum]